MVETFFHQQLQFTRSFKKKLNEQLSAAGLFHSQWLVLYCIHKLEPVTLVEISNYLDVEKPTVSRTIKRLDEQELLETVPSSDKREKRIQLATKGKEKYEKGQEIVNRFEKRLAEGITETDRLTTLQTIQTLEQRLKQEEID